MNAVLVGQEFSTFTFNSYMDGVKKGAEHIIKPTYLKIQTGRSPVGSSLGENSRLGL